MHTAITATIVWLLTAMQSWVPGHFDHKAYEWQNARETEADTRARYEAIARAAFDAAYAPDARSVPEWGTRRRAFTALLMLSISSWETYYRRDADLGIMPYGRGDHGASWCLMQLRVGNGTTAEGWSGPELVADRGKCFKAGLTVLARTWNGGSDGEALSSYASGRRITDKQVAKLREHAELFGQLRTAEAIQRKSAERAGRARRWMGQHPPPHLDAEVMGALLGHEPTHNDNREVRR